jgi:anthranilate synthase/aminodeoxychorismate synthase-like glutamine amidotransferase
MPAGGPPVPDAAARAFRLEQFHDFLALERGSAANTQLAYARDVARFATFAAAEGIRDPGEATPRQLRAFVYHLKDLGLAPSSVRRTVSAVRTYYRFLLDDGHVARDPSERLDTPARWRTLPGVLSVADVERLLAAPTVDQPLAFRDRAMLELAYGAGLRVSEWITLAVRDLLFEDQLVRVFGKGSKERLVPVGRSAIGAAAVYVRELRPRLDRGAGKGVLFLNARGEPLTRMGRGRSSAATSTPRASRRRCRRTRSGTRSPPTCSRAGPTFAPYRRCSATRASPRRRSTRTSIASTSAACTGSIIPGHDPRHRQLRLVHLQPRPVPRRPRGGPRRPPERRGLGRRGRGATAARGRPVPGPCTPSEAGVTVPAIRRWGAELPMLGVCLGHQAVGQAYGGRVVRAGRVMHGKTSRLAHDGTGLFAGLPAPLTVMRYHSLVIAPESMPAALHVTARATDDPSEVHAVRHRDHPVWGVQFHPESVLTEGGRALLANFLGLADAFHAARRAPPAHPARSHTRAA